jgi:hypothetical protein
MAHAYDTGLAKPQRTLIREAVMARLALLKKPTLYLQAVVALPLKIQGRSDEEGISSLFEALNGAAPAVAVVLGRGDVAAAGQSAAHTRKTIELVVYVASNNSRGLVDGRLAGDPASAASNTADPGIETMAEHVSSCSSGSTLASMASRRSDPFPRTNSPRPRTSRSGRSSSPSASTVPSNTIAPSPSCCSRSRRGTGSMAPPPRTTS